MKITIEKKEYQLKFGYKVYRKVCQHYGEKTVAGFEKLIKRFGLNNVKLKDPKFDSLNFIGNLVLFAIVLDTNEELTIDSDDVVDVLWKQPLFARASYGKVSAIVTNTKCSSNT